MGEKRKEINAPAFDEIALAVTISGSNTKGFWQMESWLFKKLIEEVLKEWEGGEESAYY